MSENIYDRLSSAEAIRIVSRTFKDEKNMLRNTIHKLCGLSIGKFLSLKIYRKLNVSSNGERGPRRFDNHNDKF